MYVWPFFKITHESVTKNYTENLVTFTKEILNGKHHLLCSVKENNGVKWVKNSLSGF